LDSGCNAHFLIANAHFKNKVLTQTPLEVRLPNGAAIASAHTATLNLPSLPHAAREAHKLPGLTHHSLLNVGGMCDSGCVVTFTANTVAVTHGATTILTGQRDKESDMWSFPLGNTTSAQAAPGNFYTMYVGKNPSRTPLHSYIHVFSALCKTLGSRLFKMDILQHGHL
jgi:hypothetical protein